MSDRECQMADAIARAEQADAEEADDVEYHRVAPPKDPSQVYSVRIPVARIDQLRRIAAQQGVRPSVLMREWVIERLEREAEPRPTSEVVRVVYMPCSPGVATRAKLDELDATIREVLIANSPSVGT